MCLAFLGVTFTFHKASVSARLSVYMCRCVCVSVCECVLSNESKESNTHTEARTQKAKAGVSRVDSSRKMMKLFANFFD